MKITRIQVENFRNFRKLDIPLQGSVVLVGENSVGKSNLLYALRLIFDPTLPDSARHLSQADFWDGLGEPLEDERIIISVELKEFDLDLGVLALLTEFRLEDKPDTVRLTYEFRPRDGLEEYPASSDDYEFVCYGGSSDSRRITTDVRRRVAMDLLPALRDAESDLANWRRSPLRPLLERAFSNVPSADLNTVRDAVHGATVKLASFDSVQELETSLSSLFSSMTGPKQDIKPSLGFATTDVSRLYRNIRLLIDDGLRTIGEASLGSANVAFLTLKALELRQLMMDNRRSHTLLAIEEPEAHLHPHLQRSVYKRLFDGITDKDGDERLSLLLTTHSPHIASVAPLRSLVLLRQDIDGSTVATSAASISLTEAEESDLARYLDVTRAEMLFARGIILVEGDAEKFLVPTFAASMGANLDHLGITVCSVGGTNFTPYAKFLAAMEIPFSIMTDWDPASNRKPLGFNRSLKLVRTIEEARKKSSQDALIKRLSAITDYVEFEDACGEFGVFTNAHTLEIDLFNDSDFRGAVIQTLREQSLSTERKGRVDAWESKPSSLDSEEFIKVIESDGKGRFAQRLASRIENIAPLWYAEAAIKYVVDRV